MPDILLEIAAGLYFYLRDDKRVGLSFKCECGKDHYLAFEAEQLAELLQRVVARFIADNAQLNEFLNIARKRGEQHERARQEGWNEANTLRPLSKGLTAEEVDTVLNWFEHGDKHDDEDCGKHRRVTLPEELYNLVVAHLGKLREVTR